MGEKISGHRASVPPALHACTSHRREGQRALRLRSASAPRLHLTSERGSAGTAPPFRQRSTPAPHIGERVSGHCASVPPALHACTSHRREDQRALRLRSASAPRPHLTSERGSSGTAPQAQCPLTLSPREPRSGELS